MIKIYYVTNGVLMINIYYVTGGILVDSRCGPILYYTCFTTAPTYQDSVEQRNRRVLHSIPLTAREGLDSHHNM